MDGERIFSKWLRSRGGVIAACLAFAGLLAASFYLYRLPLLAVLYPSGLCAALGAASGAGLCAHGAAA